MFGQAGLLSTPRRRLIAGAIAIGLAFPILATGFGLWMGSDRLAWSGKADCLIVCAGDRRHEIAAEHLAAGHTSVLWVVHSPDNQLVELGILPPDSSINRKRLIDIGVPAERVHVIPVECESRDLPRLIQQMNIHASTIGKGEIGVLCLAHEVRMLRHIADAVLSPADTDRWRFIPVPSERYNLAWWWLSRTGYKEVWVTGHHLLSNLLTGPTVGFDDPRFDPDKWIIDRETATYVEAAPP